MNKEEMFPIEKSNLFIEWQLEKEEINKLKWIESEKAGYDIGWDRAYWVWIMRYRNSWRAYIRSTGQSS